MPASGYRQFVPSIPESAFDRAAHALRDALPPGEPASLVFGQPDCPPGAALVETMSCCWYFEQGATKIIERLSLGASNAWLVNWICEPGIEPVSPDGGTPASADDLHLPLMEKPWVVKHLDVGLQVFPTDIDVVLHGDRDTVRMPVGTQVGRMAYSPNGQGRFAPRNRSYAVAHAFTGFGLLFDCMDQAATRGLPIPEFFLGDALEKRMCHFLKHFGFDVIDNGEFGATVFAPVERVRASLDRNRARGERLLARANREAIV